MAASIGKPMILGSRATARIPELLSRLGIVGGAVYDALVALAAAEHGAELATRDLRAKATYEAVSVRVVVAGGQRTLCWFASLDLSDRGLSEVPPEAWTLPDTLVSGRDEFRVDATSN
jgi:hypothetical protein